jgi:hypothetical protein
MTWMKKNEIQINEKNQTSKKTSFRGLKTR